MLDGFSCSTSCKSAVSLSLSFLFCLGKSVSKPRGRIPRLAAVTSHHPCPPVIGQLVLLGKAEELCWFEAHQPPSGSWFLGSRFSVWGTVRLKQVQMSTHLLVLLEKQFCSIYRQKGFFSS